MENKYIICTQEFDESDWPAYPHYCLVKGWERSTYMKEELIAYAKKVYLESEGATQLTVFELKQIYRPEIK